MNPDHDDMEIMRAAMQALRERENRKRVGPKVMGEDAVLEPEVHARFGPVTYDLPPGAGPQVEIGEAELESEPPRRRHGF